MLVQLPNDAKSMGYRKTKPFYYEQIFYSAMANFTGTEWEFVENGHGYAYEKIGDHARLVIDYKKGMA